MLRIETARPILTAVALLAACACPAERPAGEGGAGASLAGSWRAVLSSPGGELPFTLRISEETPGDGLRAVAVNGAEEAPFSAVTRQGRRVDLEIDWYDATITAELSEDGNRLSGEWSRAAGQGRSRLPFLAVRGDEHRFQPASGAGISAGDPTSIPSVTGAWAVLFTDEDGTEPARGEFTQDGAHVTGTFLTPTGDYRFLEGDYAGGLLRLSCFDGSHAFLFHARAQADGTLEGDFWSRDTYHATWTARRIDEEGGAVHGLPDPFEIVGLRNPGGGFRFTFPDLEGRPVSFPGPRFAGRVVLVNLFGSWCPNCNDEAPLLDAWHSRDKVRGLVILGLAYEMTGEPERDGIFVRRFARRHGIDYPLLLAGTADKAAASETLPDLTRVAAFPTSIFIGRDGTVRRIHSGFAGPGTGDHHRALVARLEELIERLLEEPAPEV
jgi:thiol-disulfide isomerase/thioredoxin